ncbi:MAG TPA: aminotransferase class I/II-fold pyridoxal phosphate-dependent enzyme [Candidatus Limnocylindrales bacterium]|nr:aminotransferase class I/II-fold pyridoxal phosphate-dependent enzyme [Candidatus Limnocylindrales bacterium]
MSPTPVTTNLPTQPAGYSWEATDEEVAARYGVPIDQIIRFDLNTSPVPPELAGRLLAAGRFETPLSEYPPSDYRRLIEIAARVYGVGTDELLVGAGADEILDLIGKAFLPAGGRAVVPVPTYAMYRVVTEQRAAVADLVPRLGRDSGFALDLEATREAARTADVVWLCSPNNPTGLPEPDGAIETLLDVVAVDALSAGRSPAIVVLDEAYAEFVGSSLLGLRDRHPNLVVVRTASKAYALAGLRVGFAIARPETIARIAPYRPPGSVSTVSVTVVTEALSEPSGMVANVERVDAERDRLSAALRNAGWDVGPTVTNFVLVDFATPERAALVATGMLRRGLVPRTFPAGHPLAHALRLTIRDRAGDDRLIAAANELRGELAAGAP